MTHYHDCPKVLLTSNYSPGPKWCLQQRMKNTSYYDSVSCHPFPQILGCLYPLKIVSELRKKFQKHFGGSVVPPLMTLLVFGFAMEIRTRSSDFLSLLRTAPHMTTTRPLPNFSYFEQFVAQHTRMHH